MKVLYSLMGCNKLVMIWPLRTCSLCLHISGNRGLAPLCGHLL